MHARDAFQYLLLLAFVHLCDRVFQMTERVCRWKPFWIPVGDTFQKAYLEELQLVDDGSIRDPSVAILAQAISCSNVHGVFPVHLSKCLQPSFVVSHFFSCHVRAMEQMCLHLRYLLPLRIWVLLIVLFMTLKEQDTAPERWRKTITKCSYKSQKCRHSCRVSPDSKVEPSALPDSGFIR